MISMKIRQSSAKAYAQCERKYKYAVVDKLVPLQRKPALSIGTAAHAGRAEWLRSWDLTRALEATLASVDAETKLFPSLFEKIHESKFACDCVACIKRKCLELMSSYCSNFHLRFPSGALEIIALEVPIETKLAEWEDVELWVHGTADADVIYGGKYRCNFEFKTTSKDIAHFVRTERLSRQHTIYPLVLQKIMGSSYYGTLLDVSRKPMASAGPVHDHFVFAKTDDDYAEAMTYYVELLKRIAYSMSNDYWPQNPDSCFTTRGVCEYFMICEFSEDPRIVKNNYAVVDDGAKPLEEESE